MSLHCRQKSAMCSNFIGFAILLALFMHSLCKILRPLFTFYSLNSNMMILNPLILSFSLGNFPHISFKRDFFLKRNFISKFLKFFQRTFFFAFVLWNEITFVFFFSIGTTGPSCIGFRFMSQVID